MVPHVVVVGAGPAGYVAAIEAKDLGAQVTLVGVEDVGGTCLHRGCIPTKTLIASCKVLTQVNRAAEFGLVLDGDVRADWGALRERMAKVVGTNQRGIEELLRNRGIDTVSGLGRMIEPGTIRVNGKNIHADQVLLCTGSQPLIPPLFELDEEQVCSSDEVLKWETLPRSVVMIGGGVIACEFAFVFRALGVEVTMVEMADRPLPAEDPEVSRVLAREMKKRKIRFVGGTAVTAIGRNSEGVALYVGEDVVAQGERAVVAVGRSSKASGLGLAELGVATGSRGEILVDEHMRTNVKGVYAAGDVTGKLMLAHAASAQARVAVHHMLGVDALPYVNENVPRVTFTDPEVASVGLDEETARARFGGARVGRFDFRSLGKAHALGEIAGFVKLIGHPETAQIVGAHIIGAHAAELIHEVAVLLSRECDMQTLINTVHAHPTLSEAIQEAAEDAMGQALHKPRTTKESMNEQRRRMSV